jgi:hypothetical protein
VEEAAEAARAEDVRARVRDGAHRAVAHVAPVQVQRPPAPTRAAGRRRRHGNGGMSWLVVARPPWSRSSRVCGVERERSLKEWMKQRLGWDWDGAKVTQGANWPEGIAFAGR